MHSHNGLIKPLLHPIEVGGGNSPVGITEWFILDLLELIGDVVVGEGLQGGHLGEALLVELLSSECFWGGGEVGSGVEFEVVSILDLESELKGSASDQIGLGDGIEAREEDHGSEYDDQNEDETDPTRNLGELGEGLAEADRR